MANPRKRKLAKLAVLGAESFPNATVAADMESIANGTSALGTDGQAAVRELARSANAALATDDSGNINPDTTVSRRQSLKFVAGESELKLGADAQVSSTYTETAVPHYVMADGNCDSGDASGVVFDNSFDALNIPAFFAPIGRDVNGDIIFTIDLDDSIISAQDETHVLLTYHNSLRILSDDAGDDGFATDGTCHDVVDGAVGANLSHSLNIERSDGEGGAGNDLTFSQIEMRINLNAEGGAAPAWAQGDIVRVTTASGTVWDFTATGAAADATAYEFDVVTGNTTNVTASLLAAIDACPALDAGADGDAATSGGGNAENDTGDILIDDVFGQGTDAGLSCEVLRSGNRILNAQTLDGDGVEIQPGGVGTFLAGVALGTDGLGVGASGGGRAGGNFRLAATDDSASACTALTVDGDGIADGAATNAIAVGADSDTVQIQFDEFPVRIRYSAPAANDAHEVGDLGFVVEWSVVSP